MAEVRHVVIIDAGSSGSRIYVYKWRSGFSQHSPLKLERVYPKADTPGHEKEINLSLHLQNPAREADMRAYFHGMLAGVKEGVPDIGNAEIYLLGTGGLRELAEKDSGQSNRILAAACIALQHEAGELGRFNVNCGHVKMITGVNEGIYAWVAWNYGFRRRVDFRGVLEMGGASIQVAFAEKAGESEFDLHRVCLVAGDHNVYAQTWDGFGADSMRARYTEDLARRSTHSGHIPDPCLPTRQLGEEVWVDNTAYYPYGTGEFEKCQESTTVWLNHLLEDSEPMPKYGDMSPPIKAWHRSPPFMGVGNYWHTFEFFSTRGPGYDVGYSFDMTAFKRAVEAHCSAEDNGQPDPFAHNRCFNAAWILSGLEEGLEMRMTSRADGKGAFYPTKGKYPRASWTIGAAALVANHDDLVYCRPRVLNTNTSSAIEGSRGTFADDTPFAIDEEAPLPAPAPHSIPLHQLYLPGLFALFALFKLFTWYRARRSSSRGAILLPVEKDEEASEFHIPLPADQKMLHVSHPYATK